MPAFDDVIVPRWAVTWALGLGTVAVAKLALAYDYGKVARAWWLWPGMDPERFHQQPAAAPTSRELGFAWSWIALGAALLWGLVPRLADRESAVWAGLLGIGLMLHVGAARLLSIHWRARGHAAHPLFDRPLAARSLGEFWGRRWNRGFRDVTERWVYRPLRPRLGPRGAAAAVFAVSGLGHDVVLSLPAGGGFGRCSAYFAIQFLGLLCERRTRSRIVTLAVVAVPLPLLFHGPFREHVARPFLCAIGALPC